ncbi:origin recognition complex subunit 5 C-terminus-domain-containing protein [Irpex rosettiformis]|uniref:Origin recognition complex subunit 5 C-terminus-domain-containing protein n=1 Tax=Irpex rosettiformis TaxID=378272 RepID=A0ACB8U559_9APHY|nr:origin recognition complex subunit 5 C-terminus-domain-containing protein [Irpex rosettiformis]
MEQGYEDAISHITSLISTYPPPFIYIHDPATPHLAALAVRASLDRLRESSDIRIRYAAVDAISCFNPRLLYDTVLNALAEWEPEWDQGCSNWSGPSEQRFNESLDGFLHGLQAVQASFMSPNGQIDGKGKARENTVTDEDIRLVILVERAERLKESMHDILVPLSRLRELSRTEVTLILLSDVSWEHIKPPLGAAPDPYYIDIGPLSKQAILRRLEVLFPTFHDTQVPGDQTYDPALRPLYAHFVSTLYGICSPYITDPNELAYIAASQWPGFVRPILDEHERRVDEHQQARMEEEDGIEPHGEEEVFVELRPPTEDVRIRLMRLFTPLITAALDTLYPRLSFANAWAKANVPPTNLLSIPPRQLPSIPIHKLEDQDSQATLKSLPRMAKFILVASFIASNNPAKTDMRMFGRGRDERKKRRGGSPRKMSAKSTAVKIPQRQLGPMAFPLDRMVAILGVLLEENDADYRPPAPEYTIPGEYTEMEISRITVFSQVMELSASHLLYRTSPHDRLEMSPTFKCGIGFDAALGLARDIAVPLHDLLWDPV